MEYHQVSEQTRQHLQFWDAWTKSAACFLNENEILIIENYAFKTIGFSGDLLSSYKMENWIALAERLSEEQRVDYRKYKEEAIIAFLSGILKVTDAGNKELFMKTQINKLEINSDLKSSLSKLSIHTFNDFFQVFSKSIT